MLPTIHVGFSISHFEPSYPSVYLKLPHEKLLPSFVTRLKKATISKGLKFYLHRFAKAWQKFY